MHSAYCWGEGAGVPEEKCFDIEKNFVCVFLKRYAFFWKYQISNLQKPELYRYFCWFSGILNNLFFFLMFPQKETKGSKFSEVEHLSTHGPYSLFFTLHLEESYF